MPDDNPSQGAGVHPYTVAIPARDEADLIGAALGALAEQEDAPPFAVVLLLNNCVDATASVVAQIAPRLPYPLHVFDISLEGRYANAAWARRLATSAASQLTHPSGVVLTTDADSRADKRWLASTVDCLDRGADVVCGFVSPDFGDAPPLSFDALRIGALEFEYSQLISEISSQIVPDESDPWPNHMIETGANLAIRTRALFELGGVPHVCPGEDQELVAHAKRAGFKVRHAFAPAVVTSSRIRGRAEGGWSEDLDSRNDGSRRFCHPRLESADALIRRLRLRERLNRLYGGAQFEAVVAQHAPAETEAVITAPTFESAWARLEAFSPSLRREPLPVSELERSVERIRAELERRAGVVQSADSR